MEDVVESKERDDDEDEEDTSLNAKLSSLDDMSEAESEGTSTGESEVGKAALRDSEPRTTKSLPERALSVEIADDDRLQTISSSESYGGDESEDIISKELVDDNVGDDKDAVAALEAIFGTYGWAIRLQ